MTETLPLLDLFTRLREAGLPLGVDEYRLVLQALQAGFGLADQAVLKRVCRALWVKSADDLHLFEYHFEQAAPELTAVEPEIRLPEPSHLWQETLPAFSPPVEAEPDTPPVEPLVEQEPVARVVMPPAPTPPPPTEFVLGVEDELQVAQAMQIANADDDILYGGIALSDEYFPVTRRQMKQSWRHLRQMAPEGSPTELDMDATIQAIGRQGILLEPVLTPRRVNRVELILLIDQGGSMAPFHALSRRLADTAIRGGRLERAGIYYFHNSPAEYLYHDPALYEWRLVSEIIAAAHPQRTVVLIFSDAGAARGGFSADRIDLTKAFLDRVSRHMRRVVWLNPMPRTRWPNTTAEEIARSVPMFETNRRGLDSAIDVLRGRLVYASPSVERAR